MSLLGFGRFRYTIKIAFNPPFPKRSAKQRAKSLEKSLEKSLKKSLEKSLEKSLLKKRAKSPFCFDNFF
jgi:hypothetical protein